MRKTRREGRPASNSCARQFPVSIVPPPIAPEIEEGEGLVLRRGSLLVSRRRRTRRFAWNITPVVIVVSGIRPLPLIVITVPAERIGVWAYTVEAAGISPVIALFARDESVLCVDDLAAGIDAEAFADRPHRACLHLTGIEIDRSAGKRAPGLGGRRSKRSF